VSAAGPVVPVVVGPRCLSLSGLNYCSLVVVELAPACLGSEELRDASMNEFAIRADGDVRCGGAPESRCCLLSQIGLSYFCV